MKNKQIQAIKLRKEGKSYSQINNILSVPKSTLSYWLKEIRLSKNAQSRIDERKFKKSTLKLIERNKSQTEIAIKKAEKIREEAKKEFFQLKSESLFLSGVSLYWAEGYKKGAYGSRWKVVDFVNSDEEMILIMMKFYRKYFKIKDSKIKIQLIAHPNIDIEKAMNRWSKLTKISKKQFIKTYAKVTISSKGIRNKKSLINGTVHIRIYDVGQFFRMIGWIDGLKEYLLVA